MGSGRVEAPERPLNVEGDLPPWTGGIVATIETDRRDPFDVESLGDLGFLGRTANRLHAVTWESVVRDLLIIEEGQVLTPALAREASRVLRRSGIFRDARVFFTPRADSVDVLVRTIDRWSTQLIANYSRAGSDDRLTLGALESNFLGSSDALFGVYSWSDEENRYSVGATKRRFLNHHARVDVTYSQGDDTDSRRASFSKSDYSDINRFSGAIEAERFRGSVTIYEGGEETGEFLRRRDRFFAGGSLFVPGSTRWQLGASVALNDVRDRPSAGETLEPDWLGFRNDRRRQVTLGLGASSRRFVQRRYVNGSGIVEDLPVGALATFAVGAELEALGSTGDRPFVGGRLAAGRFVADGLMIAGRVEAQAHWRDSVPDGVLIGAAVRAFRQFSDASMTALRLVGRAGYDFEPQTFMYLGARRGLRGFPVRSFRGTRVFVANLDQRLALPVSLAGLEPDVVLFADTGGAWEADDEVALRDVHAGVGFGIRVHSPQLVSAPLRVDIGRGLGPGGDWHVSIEVGQFFDATQSLDFRIPGAREFDSRIE